jgi:hypothetical protein
MINVLDEAWSDRKLITPLEASLLVVGAIHAAILNGDPEAAHLERFYATVGGSYDPATDQDVLLQMIGGLFLKPSETMREFLRSGKVQTNEISRGIVWLFPAIILGLPITLVDFGCSAGLNLIADSFTWRWLGNNGENDERHLGIGDPLIEQHITFGEVEPIVREKFAPGILPHPAVMNRLGFDQNILRLDDPADVLDLRACIWGDQAHRLERFDRAVEIYKTVQPPPALQVADMIQAAQKLDTHITAGSKLLLVYNTLVTTYFSDDDYAALKNNITAAFSRLPADVHGLWIEMESARAGEPHVASKHFPIKAHFLENGELTMIHIGYTEAHPQMFHFMPGWERLMKLFAGN